MSDKNNITLTPGWRRVKFGDVVSLSKARSQDPLADGIERYVGLEHLEPGDLRIRRWGNVADGVTFTSVFKPGQVLFGKRRAYQRKVAVPDFSGVCSGDIYVLETKDARALLPELLPFICQTDAFFDHAVGTSAGSLSPRTTWSSLESFEFSLPPAQQQASLLAALDALQKLAETSEEVALRARDTEQSWLRTRFDAGLNKWRLMEMQEAGDLQLGLKKERDYDLCTDPKPFLRVANVGDGELYLDDVRQMDFPGHRYERHRLLPGDVLLTEGDIVSPWNVGRAAIFRGEIENCCIQNTLMRFRPNASVDSEYALAAFRYMRSKGVFVQAAVTTTVSHLVDRRVRRVKMPVPPLDVQAGIGYEHSSLVTARKACEIRATEARKLLTTTLNGILAP
ncbi:restriction endonuclease subunit S [Luteimonas sp. MC1825]|uniref:restriction endonuclease subunit S n=1 Tax=Luteimonas sp. MC1825 TaxID=2761107 RepID=UPI00161AFA3C|nr:restriction endonuclease subunit S [Luteimonas sp. MC1825]MBB6600299.1 restriction endonuclease subunit S [Luteimonas sp. MC1825]QOC87979.1 restriction endonuclease subunit S [Luteimonas sp. MC1825]